MSLSKPASQNQLPRLIRGQEQDATPQNHRPNYRKNHLGLPATLNQRGLATILHDRARVIGEPVGQARNAQNPKNDAEGQGHPPFQDGGLLSEVEGDDDG